MRCKLPRLVKTRWKQPKHASWTSYVNAMVGFRPSPGLQRAVAGSSDIMSARAAKWMTCHVWVSDLLAYSQSLSETVLDGVCGTCG